jgi:hypothetical protein
MSHIMPLDVTMSRMPYLRLQNEGDMKETSMVAFQILTR